MFFDPIALVATSIYTISSWLLTVRLDAVPTIGRHGQPAIVRGCVIPVFKFNYLVRNTLLKLLRLLFFETVTQFASLNVVRQSFSFCNDFFRFLTWFYFWLHRIVFDHFSDFLIGFEIYEFWSDYSGGFSICFLNGFTFSILSCFLKSLSSFSSTNLINKIHSL